VAFGSEVGFLWQIARNARQRCRIGEVGAKERRLPARNTQTIHGLSEPSNWVAGPLTDRAARFGAKLSGTFAAMSALAGTNCVPMDTFGPEGERSHSMRGVILWLLGVPISIIILLYLFNVL
jgi:hypothetical protein